MLTDYIEPQEHISDPGTSNMGLYLLIGVISFSTIMGSIKYFSSTHQHKKASAVEKIIKEYDKNSDGSLDREELTKLINDYKLK